MKSIRRLGATVAALMLLGAMAACGGSDEETTTSSSSSSSKPTTIKVALDWTPNTTHTGLYVALEKGYFEDAGLDVEVLPYSTAPETLVDAGSADFGFSYQDTMTYAVASGAKLVSVMAPIQHWLAAVGVRADNEEIQTPADLDGKTYAGFGTAGEEATMRQIIKNAGGKGQFDSVELGTSAYEALYSGDVDFTFPFKTWEGIQGEESGEPMKYFDFVDYEFPDKYQIVVIGNPDWLAANGDAAKAFIQALAKGYEDAIADPDGAADILLSQNADILTDSDLVHKSQTELSSDYMLDANGAFGTQTEEQWAGLGDFLFDAGLLSDNSGAPLDTKPDWSTYFTNEYLG